MKRNTRRMLSLVLVGLLAFSVFKLIQQAVDKANAGETYDNALQAAVSVQPPEETVPETTEPAAQIVWMPEAVEEDPYLEELQEINLDALRQVNPEVIGWIRIPNTKVDYPVMQGQDNDYYLNHTWDMKKNHVGSIYMEYRNSAKLGDYNTLIYGHNMKDGSMFAQLRRYSEQVFFREHPYIYLVTDTGVLRYEVFSSYKAAVDSATYAMSFQEGQTREDFLSYVRESSVIDSGIEPGIRDRILTLSTCSAAGYTTRWVVHARLKMVQTELQAQTA